MCADSAVKRLTLRRGMLAFLHTAEVHVGTFGRLARQLGPNIEPHHVVRDDLLARALHDGGVTDETRAAVQSEVKRLLESGARVVVCTCSTLGDAAEATPHSAETHVLRIDRPMAERAIALGRPLLVVAALPTAMATASSLLQSVSAAVPPLRPLLCDQAWQRFQIGDEAGYLNEVAAAVRREARSNDVVLLAQASMAAAAGLVGRPDVEILTSPELGLRHALDLLARTI